MEDVQTYCPQALRSKRYQRHKPWSLQMGAGHENPTPVFSAQSLRLSIRCFIFE
jgi:hypothetical protein